ncbi:MAG: ribosomal-protein-alanine N-acetyltransferase [Proteobacteria bacterium]|nr:MAG: ribosomal-protein-alanine N-acetyltransferase [Pseudomonadota bacterium]
MSAVLSEAPVFRPMRVADLTAIIAIERVIYSHPWTIGNFRDSLYAGYSCWVMECAGQMVGYGVLMLGVDEAHLLNLSVAHEWQRRGLGRALLEHFIRIARSWEARSILLEVRPSNVAARLLYEQAGFRELSVRGSYYPAEGGREDAILMGMELERGEERRGKGEG